MGQLNGGSREALPDRDEAEKARTKVPGWCCAWRATALAVLGRQARGSRG